MKPTQKQPFDALVEIIREMMRAKLSRRTMLAAGGFAAITAAARAAGGLGNPDLPPEGAVNVTNPKALTDPGPQDPGLAGHEPSFLNPPATDVNGMPQFWASFNLAPKRIQNGGWSEFNTLLVTDWIAHTPPEVLAKNFGLPVEVFKNIPLHNRWIYQSNPPAPPLETVEAQMAAAAGK